jgi:hypothetical protein
VSVYKYMTADGGIRFLSTWVLRITPPADFNDPFELRPPAQRLFTQEYLEQALRSGAPDMAIEELSQQLLRGLQGRLTAAETTEWVTCMIKPPDARTQTRILKNVRRKVPGLSHTKLLAMQNEARRLWPIFMQRAGAFAANVLPEINALMQRGFTERLPSMLGVLCLSRNGNEALMWSHYADSHKGVVIEFDDSHSAFNRRRSPGDEFGCLRSVVYSKDRPELNMQAVDDDTVFQVFALTKAEQWRYEEEVRLIWPLQFADKTIEVAGGSIALLTCDPSAVKSVTFGCKTQSSTVQAVRHALAQHPGAAHITLKRASLHDTTFELIYRNLDVK